jgi:hypothetical protein
MQNVKEYGGNAPQAVFRENLIFHLNIFNFWPGAKFHDFSRFSLNCQEYATRKGQLKFTLLVGGLTSKKLHFVRKAPNLAWTFIWTM